MLGMFRSQIMTIGMVFLGIAVLTVILVIFQIVSHYASGGTYKELQRRRLEKKKRCK